MFSCIHGNYGFPPIFRLKNPVAAAVYGSDQFGSNSCQGGDNNGPEAAASNQPLSQISITSDQYQLLVSMLQPQTPNLQHHQNHSVNQEIWNSHPILGSRIQLLLLPMEAINLGQILVKEGT